MSVLSARSVLHYRLRKTGSGTASFPFRLFFIVISPAAGPCPIRRGPLSWEKEAGEPPTPAGQRAGRLRRGWARPWTGEEKAPVFNQGFGSSPPAIREGTNRGPFFGTQGGRAPHRLAGVGAGGAKGKSYGTIRLPFTPLEAQAGGHPAEGRVPVPGVQAVRQAQAGHHGSPHPARGRVSGACLYRQQPGEFMQHLSPESPSRERSERNCFKIPISVLSRGVLGKETGAGKDIAEGIMTKFEHMDIF